MHKLTPIFIGGALAISAGLAIAQSQLNTDTTMQGHDMPGHSMPASDNPSTQAYIEANNRMHADMTVDFTGDADIDLARPVILICRNRRGASAMMRGGGCDI